MIGRLRANGFGLWVAWVVAALLCRAALAAPKLEFEPKVIDFGRMREGTELRKILVIRNDGDADLVINQVRPSCTECVVDRLEKITLAPGEQRELPVTYRADLVPGKQSANITFHSNDTADPLKRVFLEVEITPRDAKPRIQTRPDKLELGIVRLGQTAKLALVARNAGDGGLKIEDSACGPGVSISALPGRELEAEAEHTFQIEVLAAAPGVFRSHLSLVSNDPDRRVVTLPVSGYAAEEREIAALIQGLVLRPEWTTGPAGPALTGVMLSNYSLDRFIAGLPGDEGMEVAPGAEIQLHPKIAESAPSQQKTIPLITLSVFQPTATPEEK